MPAAVQYVDPNSKLRDTHLNVTISEERKKRKEEYDKSRKYYEGDQKHFLSKKAGEPDDNVIINVTRMAIDRTQTFLFPQMPALELAPAETGATKEEKWVRAAWEFNGGVLFLQDCILNGSLSGHNYVRVLPLEKGELYPRLVNLDPTGVFTYWQADDIDTVLWHEVTWDVMEDEVNNVLTEYLQDIVHIKAEQRWEIHQYKRLSGTQWVEQEEFFQRWDFKFGPIIDWKHLPDPNRFYGKSETDHLPLQDKLNLVVSENARINRYHSSPKTVGTGIKPGDIKDTGIDDFWSTENEKAQIYNLEMKSNQAFAQNLAEFMYDTYLAESRVVLLRGEVKDFQRVTNAGVRTVFMDMLSKNMILRRLYAIGIQKITRAMGMVSGMGLEIIPDVIYPDPLPVDDAELVNINAIERSMGVVSRETISEKRGYIWTDELTRMEQEAELEIFAAPEETEEPADSEPAQSDT